MTNNIQDCTTDDICESHYSYASAINDSFAQELCTHAPHRKKEHKKYQNNNQNQKINVDPEKTTIDIEFQDQPGILHFGGTPDEELSDANTYSKELVPEDKEIIDENISDEEILNIILKELSDLKLRIKYLETIY
jgi:Ser-tRNA(Ala) deacylase AlaX